MGSQLSAPFCILYINSVNSKVELARYIYEFSLLHVFLSALILFRNPYLRPGCQDINECQSNPCNDENEICSNTPGSYQCTCREGYFPGDRESGVRCIPLSSIEPSRRSAKLLVYSVVGSSVGLLLLLTVSFRLYKVVKKRQEQKRKQKFFKRNGGLLLQQQVSTNEGLVEKTRLFTAKELSKATDQFNESRILGRGGQGTVYKGMISDGRIVAVKKSKLVGENQLEPFINEVVILSQINHRNVVKLLGCCLETKVPMLVYEFLPNRTLFDHIHDESDDFPMTWDLLSGQKPVSSSVAEDERSLVKRFLTSMEQNCLTKIIDPKISEHCKDEEVISAANIAYRCLNLNGIRRPTMKEVAIDLENIRLSRRPTTIKRTLQVTDTESDIPQSPCGVSTNMKKNCNLLLLLWLPLSLAISNQTLNNSIITKPGCPAKCGNVTVPYSFGIGLGSGCSVGSWFDINCSTSFTPLKAFLSTGNIEVINISDPKIRVKNLVASHCYNELGALTRGNHAWVNLRTTPYSVSNENVLTVLGCDDLSLGVSQNVSGGCMALCSDSKELSKESCLGVGCCQAYINECESNPCDNENGICINTPGDYNRSCPNGYIGDGRKSGVGCILLSSVECPAFN
ncbi:wall-associated receptor kinase-like 8 [Olea europaea subsp. europaea]|uniref:Wall-associated receptor kinase-like 8 n=1 Tax=Olea europaea subsp. europaea TaxID=158383 RepID=A0A8S0SM91_OLEEU|nr:wall-associated receptor kinase-like 8 [Olea europaea subsp. europaea]